MKIFKKLIKLFSFKFIFPPFCINFIRFLFYSAPFFSNSFYFFIVTQR